MRLTSRRNNRNPQANRPAWDRRRQSSRVPEWFYIVILLLVAIAISSFPDYSTMTCDELWTEAPRSVYERWCGSKG